MRTQTEDTFGPSENFQEAVNKAYTEYLVGGNGGIGCGIDVPLAFVWPIGWGHGLQLLHMDGIEALKDAFDTSVIAVSQMTFGCDYHWKASITVGDPAVVFCEDPEF
jgi:hypothetical protein